MSSAVIDVDDVATKAAPLYAYFVFYSIVFFIGMLSYRNWINGKMFDKHVDSVGRVAIVTGANTGIGKETALGLARYGVHVILACRNLAKGTEARDEIISATGNPNVQCMKLDLSSFKSIRSFAAEFLATRLPLHILINNAGVMGIQHCLTEDGLEQHIGVNHFGHFLLTMLLLRRLLESKPSRVITVSSWGHRLATMRKDDLMGERNYNRFFAYEQSKLANIYFSMALAKRMANTGVTSNSLHPGVILTDISRHLDTFSWLLQKWFCDLFSTIFLRTTKSGAQTSIYAALDFSIQNVSGTHLSNMELAMTSPNAKDDEMAEWLWCKSEEITGVKFEECIPETLAKH